MGPRTLQLLSVVTHTSPITITREDTIGLLPRLAGSNGAAAHFRRTVDGSRIDTRHVETTLDELARLGITDRARLFETRFRALAEILGQKALDTACVDPAEISVVVTTSCTGYMLPSVDAYVIPRLGIAPDARRVPITELGCSAGVGAIGVASEILHVRQGYALVISVELCSSCMQTTDLAPSDVIGNILFADAGAAAVIGPSNSQTGPEIVATRTVLWPDTTDALGMRLTDTGLRLVLSPELPSIVGDRISSTVNAFLEANRVRKSDLAFWAVHPGGPRILDVVGDRLALSHADLEASWDIWRHYGNVSSATIFLILEALGARGPILNGRGGLMMAFGPGLTCELVLLRSGGWFGHRR